MTNYTSENKPSILRAGDRVIFICQGKTLTYGVNSDHLNCHNGENDYIFDLLGWDKKERAASAYGYAVRWGCWPCSREDDFPALTRLVLDIYLELEGSGSEVRGGALDTRRDLIQARVKLFKAIPAKGSFVLGELGSSKEGQDFIKQLVTAGILNKELSTFTVQDPQGLLYLKSMIIGGTRCELVDNSKTTKILSLLLEQEISLARFREIMAGGTSSWDSALSVLINDGLVSYNYPMLSIKDRARALELV